MIAVTRREAAVAAAVVLGLTAAVWGASLGAGFFFDDVHNLERAAAAPWTPAGLAQGFSVFDSQTVDVWCAQREAVSFFRPAFVASLKLDHALWGTWAPGFHLSNLLLHALNALLIWLLWRGVGLPRRGALLAAALFAGFAHHTVAVIWIAGRTELLLAVFVLGSLVCHVHALDGGPRWARPASWALALGALLTKENAVVLPAYLALAEWLAAGRRWPSRALLAAAGRRLLPVTAICAAYLVLRVGVMGLGEPPPAPYYISPADAAFPGFLAVKTLYYYGAWLTFVPIMPVAPVAFLIDHPSALLAVAGVTVAGWGAIGYALRGEARLPALLAFTAVCQIPVAMLMASNHYVYLGGAAVAALLALLLLRRGTWTRPGKLGLAAIGLLCALNAAYGHLSYHGFSTANERLAAGIAAVDEELLDGPAELYLVNLPFFNAHQGQRLRVLHGADGLRAHLLTVSSEPFAPGPPPELRWRDEQTLQIDLPDGLFPGELGSMFSLAGADVWPGWEHRAGPAQVIPHADGDGAVRQLTVEFEPEAEPHVLLLRPAEDGQVEIVRSSWHSERAAVIDPSLFGEPGVTPVEVVAGR